jgi:hypothetical protein
VGGQGGGLSGQSENGGSQAAGQSGEAGEGGAGLETSSGGSYAGNGSGGSGEQASGGSTTTRGGAPGLNECAWQPASPDQCPACDVPSDCAPPSYKYVGSGAVSSSCCGFEWQEATAPGKYSWSEASEYCASLSRSGSGWRLPKIAELFSLVDLSDSSHSTPTINVDALSDTLREAYWSASPDGDSGQASWSVSFDDGSSQSSNVNAKLRVRCVR